MDRTYSAFLHHIRAGRIPLETNLLAQLGSVPPEEDRLGLVSGSWYADSLAPYFERFGGRLEVFLHDDVLTSPEKVYARSIEHLGASPGFEPADLARIRNSGKPPAESPYAGDEGRRDLSLEERAVIFEYFRHDVRRLEEVLGRDLSPWRPAGA